MLELPGAARVDVLRLQNAAWNAMEWFEVVGALRDQLPPEQFMYSMLTRSQRISHENLRLRDASLARREGWFERGFASSAVSAPPAASAATPAATDAHRRRRCCAVRDVVLKNRVVVSPMAQYSRRRRARRLPPGAPGRARAMGGAGMVVAEMTCPSPDARITPGCPGCGTRRSATPGSASSTSYAPHRPTPRSRDAARPRRPKGSTNAPWDGAGADQPLARGNWPLVAAPRSLPADGLVPARDDRADMDRVKATTSCAAPPAAEAGFDWLELHCAHGYLLSSFISPLTNRRATTTTAARSPTACAIRSRCLRRAARRLAAAAADVGAHLGARLGRRRHHARRRGRDRARLQGRRRRHDRLLVRPGQRAQKPTYGRMYQTPFADRIRNEAGIATIAVGAISEADHVNSIIAAGRADLCAVAGRTCQPGVDADRGAKIGFTAAQPGRSSTAPPRRAARKGWSASRAARAAVRQTGQPAP